MLSTTDSARLNHLGLGKIPNMAIMLPVEPPKDNPAHAKNCASLRNYGMRITFLGRFNPPGTYGIPAGQFGGGVGVGVGRKGSTTPGAWILSFGFHKLKSGVDFAKV